MKIRSVFLLVVISSLALYLAGFRYVGSGDTRPAELIPQALLAGEGFDLQRFFPQHGDLPYYVKRSGARVVSSYSIVPGILNLPLHLLRAQLFPKVRVSDRSIALVSASFAAALAVGFVYLLLVQRLAATGTALLLTAVFASGTSMFSIAARGMWEHTASILFLSAGLAALANPRSGLVRLSGMLFALAVWSRSLTLIFGLGALTYVYLERRREFYGFALAAAAVALAEAAYLIYYTGSIFSLAQSGIYGIAGFDGSMLRGAIGLLLNPARGLLIFSPILIFSLMGALRLRRAGRDFRFEKVFAISALAYFLAVAKWRHWWGAHCFGPRMLIELLPILTLLAAWEWQNIVRSERVLCCAFFALWALSFYAHLLGAYIYPSGFNYKPRLIYDNPRLWSWRQTELVRCHRIFWQKLLGNHLPDYKREPL